MSATIVISAEAKRRAYDLYIHQPSISVRSIAALLGVGATTFRRLRREWAWPPRAEALVAAQAVGEAGEKPASGFDEASVSPSQGLRQAALALMAVTRARIDELAREQDRPDAATDHDRAARTLASYARTLTAAQALLEQESSRLDDTERSDAGPARSLDELGDELARHLERLVAEEEARGSDGLLV
ncbi:hypothetical protein [Microvirga thermotolerans]|uniref:Uncharacterized protein n=1 Tax=Microvirga thermotolerans TaxID=2651334 RepID=A0A5P9K453_9HYPH|nr:hypothetical protein [Microvirga thermotolerans]QFU17094.1 hypothetical protein GDR74_13175 [Microvirga thermotolerans]